MRFFILKDCDTQGFDSEIVKIRVFLKGNLSTISQSTNCVKNWIIKIYKLKRSSCVLKFNL